MMIRYYLRDPAPAGAAITVEDRDGKTVAQLKGPGKAGINAVAWDMRKASPTPDERGCTAYGMRPAPVVDQVQPVGAYRLTLDVAGHHFSQAVRIADRQSWSLAPGVAHFR